MYVPRQSLFCLDLFLTLCCSDGSVGVGGEEANKQVQLDFSDGTTATVELLPVENEDYDHYYSFPTVTTTSVRITVLTVYGTVNNGAEEIGFFSCGDVDAFEVIEVGCSLLACSFSSAGFGANFG